jgi:hypothetical protein
MKSSRIISATSLDALPHIRRETDGNSSHRDLLVSHQRRTGSTTNKRTPTAAAAAIHAFPAPILTATKIPKATAAANMAMVAAATPKLTMIS